MRKLKAGVIDAVIGHEVNRFRYRILNGFELRCRIAVTPGSRKLIVQPVNGSRNSGTGVVVRLRFDLLGNVVDEIFKTITAGNYTSESGREDGANFYDAQIRLRRFYGCRVNGAERC